MTGGRAGVSTRDETQLHAVSLGEDGLGGPAGELDAVVLHLSSNNGTALGPELAAPVEGTAGALGLAVELVEGLDEQLLVLAVDGVLHDGVDFGTNDHVDGLVVALQGEIEATVLVGLGGEGLGLLGGVVKGVRVGQGDLAVLGLDNGLQGEVVVDEGCFHGQGAGGVDGILLVGGVGQLEGSVGGVLVNGDQVQGGAFALVEVDLVALVDDDDIPGVDTAGGAHEHGQDVRGGEDGGLVLLGQFLDNGVLGGGDVVGGTVEGLETALGVLDGRLVVGPVVVVEETIRVDVLTLGGLEVQLGQTAEVNLLQHVPVGADVDRRLTGALGLVVVLPAEATATVAAATRTVVVVAVTTLATASAHALEAGTTTALGTTALGAATEDGTTATAEGTLSGAAGVVDNGEGRFVFGDLDGEEAGGTGTVDLLVWRETVSCLVLAWLGYI